MHLASGFINKLKDSHNKSRYLPKFTGKPDPFLMSKNLSKEEKIIFF